MQELEQMLGYSFTNKSLLKEALTHSSYANEVHKKEKSYERLEFLGDSILGFIIAEHLFKHNKGMEEGELTKFRSSLVCEKSLSAYARKLKLNENVVLGKGEHQLKGYDRPSILCDVFEAVLAAIYIDGGMEQAKDFIKRVMGEDLAAKKPKAFKDYKTILQEVVQRNPEEKIEYILISESGPDHNKHFVSEVHLNSNVISRGGGGSKKEAEQQAARKALELMGL